MVIFRPGMVVVVWLAVGSAMAEPPPPGLPVLEPGRLAAAESLRLEDGRSLWLAGVEQPLLPAARAMLAEQTAGDPVILYGVAGQDRWGRWPVHLVTGDGRWLQAELVRAGLARVMPSNDDDPGIARLLAIEAEARAAKRGLWADPAFALRRPDQAKRYVNSVQVFEGVVASVSLSHGVATVSFSEEWGQGLSVKIPHAVGSDLAVDVKSLRGKRARVRGWVGYGGRPQIELVHGAQIELPDGASPATMASDDEKDAP